MSYFSQMAGLAVQNFVSAGVGIAVLVAFIRGARLALGQGDRRLLRRPHARDPLRAAAAVDRRRPRARLPGRPPDAGRDARRDRAHRREQTFASGRSPARRRSRCSAPTAAASSTSTRRCRTRTRRGSRTSSRCSRSWSSRPALTATYGRMVDNRRQGWMVFGAMMTLFVVAVAVIYVNETGPTPAMQAAGLTGDNLEGKEQRFGIGSSSLFAAVTTAASCGAVNAAMESLQRARRRGPDGADDDRRGHLGRRRLRPVLDAAVRHPRRLHLRPDGRAHAGVPRQEDRGARDQADDHRHDRRADAGARRDRAGDRARSGAPRRSTTAGRRASPRRSTPTRRRATTTAPRSPATPATCSPTAPTPAPSASPSPTCSAAWRCSAAASSRCSPCSPSPARSPASASARRASGTLRTDTPTFGVVLVAVVLIVALLTFVPALLLGPVVQGLSDQLY